jgi:TPR repeat protein
MKPDLNKFAEVSIENLEHFLTEENHPEYFEYLTDLAGKGSFEAAEKLFNAYFFGDVYTEVDQPTALELLEKFAEKNQSASAANVLVEHYRFFVHDDNSNKKAVHWLEFSASLRDGDSAFQLGEAYYLGNLGLYEDEDLAAEYLEQSLEYGDHQGYPVLARIYLKSADDEKRSRGKELMTIGAKAGNAECQFELANRYLTGEDFKKDARLGISWLFKSAQQEYVEALIRLGGMYLFGEEVDKNLYEGFRCFEKASKKHSKLAQARLSSLYLLGVGVEKNLTLAYSWIRIAERNLARRAPENLSFTGELLGAHILSESQIKHSENFVTEFTKDIEWRYRVHEK